MSLKGGRESSILRQPSLGGRLGDGRHRLPIRVYYEDTDFSGVVYHASYLRFMERGRTEFLRAMGLNQRELLVAGADSLGFVVRRMTIDFMKPARMDDVITIETTPGAVGGAAITLLQRVLLEDAVLVEAEVKVAAVANGRARRLPADIRAALTAFAAGSGAAGR